MSLNIAKKMALGYGVPLALLVALGIVFMANLSGVIKQFSFVIEHDAPVVANARELSKLVIDMETGQRGFVITGKEAFLEPYNAGAGEFQRLIDKEKELVSDNPSQVKVLEKIEGLVDQWQQKAARPEIAIGKKIATNSIDAEYLQTLLANGVGKGIMDNIRSVCDEMITNFKGTGNEDGVVLSISIAKDMVDMETGHRGFIITGKEAFLEPYLAGQKRLKEHISKLRNLLSRDKKNSILLAKVKSLANDWFEKAATPEISARQEMNRHPETLKDVAALLEAGTGKNILDQIREEFKKFIKIEEGLTKNRYEDASGNAGRTRNIIIIFLIASIIFGGVVALLISRGIINSVRELSDAVGMVAKGDLTPEVKVMTDDEIGQLGVDFNQMVKDLRQSDKNEKHLNAVLRAIRNVDKLITKEKDRDRLLQGACDALIETRGFSSVWVIILDESNNIVTTAEAGFGKAFQAITERLKPGELPRCGNTTLGQSGVLITENQAPVCADCQFGSTKSIDNNAMTIRLAYEETIYGLFCASVPKEFVMDGEEKFLFQEVADDIAFALYSIDMNEKRRHAETKLASAHSQLKNVMDASRRVSIIATDPKGLIKMFNTGAEKMLGYSAEEVTEKQTPAIFHVESEISAHGRKLTEKLGRPIEGFEVLVARAGKGDYEEREWTYIRKDGTRLTVNLSVTAVYDAANQVSGFLGIAMDVTERNQVRIQLQKALDGAENARSRINHILQSIADGLIVTDPEDRIILLNPAAENMLGIPLKTSTGLPLIDLVKDENLQERFKEAFKTRTGGFSFDFESTGETMKNNRVLRVRTSEMKDSENRHTGIITIIYDVTHEREVDRMKTEFISTAAHELRTPLTSIQGFSEILLTREDLKPEEKKKFLTHINKQSVGLAAIINDLLDISRIESGRSFALNKEPWDAGDAIKQILPYFQEHYKKHSFELILPDKAVELHADKDKIGQILKNLLSNAIKFSPAGGLIRVKGKIVDMGYQVSIEDQGMGMTPDQVEKVFDKFYRVDASNTAIEGTGLGMSIVKHIVEAHGGKVWVESEFEKGTTVRFTMPVYPG